MCYSIAAARAALPALCLAAAGLMAPAATALAQSYPAKSMRFVVPCPPGGSWTKVVKATGIEAE